MIAWRLYAPWQRWGFLAILFLVTTSNYFDYYVISIVLDPIKKEFHLSDTMLGLLSGVGFAAVYAIAALPIARWSDRGNRRTIMAITLVGWSAMTMLCGVVVSFAQLMTARLGVALTEPGASPTAQSLIVDYFPPARRASALAILAQGGSAAGYCVGIGVGGYIAATFGWRSAFLWAGAPGLILALIVRVFLAEPRLQLGFPSDHPTSESAGQSLVHLGRKKSYLLAVVGFTAYAFFAFGTSVFLPSFMIRVLHATLKEVSVTWGFIVAVAMILGAVVGGLLADRLGRRDIRWYAWIPAIAFGLGAPLYWLTLSATSLWAFIAIDFPAEVILAVGYSVSFAAFHAVCGQNRRALAIAAAYFFYMLIGCGLGPLVAGMLSDAFTPLYGMESLRHSLICLVYWLVPGALAFCWSATYMREEREN